MPATLDHLLWGCRDLDAGIADLYERSGVQATFGGHHPELGTQNALARLEPKIVRLRALHDRVAELPRVAAYLASPRRLAFNQQGIFRHYPELDAKR